MLKNNTNELYVKPSILTDPREHQSISNLPQPQGGEKSGLSVAVRISENDSKPWGYLKEAGPFLTLLVKHVYLASTKTGFDHWILHFKLVTLSQ